MDRIITNYKRKAAVRDPKLIIIATEGQATEQDYFEEFLDQGKYQRSQVHIVLLKRKETSSSPKYVVSQLHEHKRKFGLRKDDKLWALIDLDQWTNNELNLVAADCESNEYCLALSNPCFEVWLLLHLKDLTEYNKKEIERICKNKHSIKEKIREFISSFDKGGNIHMQHFMNRIDKAIKNARKLDIQPQDRWPRTVGTRVYVLMENINR